MAKSLPTPTELNRAPIKSVIIFAFGLLLLQSLAEMVKLAAVLLEKEELVSEILVESDAPIRIE